eukprot:TRINITY_DN9560_c0_g1_i1.p1 TRINITY_DN9560_c0_g1~~TRINITY_DN9560_c0_g1_i1.p1  ORF type:complete len:285 (+),score=44.60 TRINITY_DN9560_c0_g1_i1:74-928(+)
MDDRKSESEANKNDFLCDSNEDRSENSEPLSKNQQKKLDRYLAVSGHKKEKRKEERQRRREKFKEKRQNGEEKPKDITKQEQLDRLVASKENGIKVCIDLQYHKIMTPKEIQRLSNQLKRVYGSNKASLKPFNLTFSSLKRDGQIYETCIEKISGFAHFQVNMIEESVEEEFDVEKLVYLSPDADKYLEDLEPDAIYVIGGIVDDTVQSKMSLQFIEAVQAECRKLPIPLYMERKDGGGGTFKQILTVNQVFDILLKFQETKSWPEALKAGVPARTGFVCKELS